MSICLADIIYHDHEPVYIFEDGYPPYHYGPYIVEGNKVTSSNSFVEELKEYGKIFVETFKKSYKDLNKPYVVEKRVPVPVPGNTIHTNKIGAQWFSFTSFFPFSVPVDHPIFIRSKPKILYRKIIYKKHGGYK